MRISKCFSLALIFVTLVGCLTTDAQQKTPRLVIGITVDQMRQEYLYRFYDKFGADGFRRLMDEGFMLRNAHYNYVPTVTGPGHASIYTGTTPAIHGIVANDWYDKQTRKEINCVNDPRQKAVGSNQASGTVSPWRLLSSTITDELKLFSNKRSKVFGISVKDRGAALPAGHLGDGAFWYDAKTGNLISSTYYYEKLPDWLVKFNEQKLADKFLSQTWNTLLPIDQYKESGPDDSPYEVKFNGKEKSTFPYDLKKLRDKNDNFDLLVFTPFANDLLTEAAKSCVQNEGIGEDEVTDFLSVSYSSTDVLGHNVGPNAVELQDMYLRLDRNLADLFGFIDNKVGKGNYVVFLTADHAVADVAQYLRDNKIPAGYFNSANTKVRLNEFMRQYFQGEDVVEEIDGGEVFLNHAIFQRDPRSSGVDYMVATELITNFLLAQEGVANVFSESVIRQGNYNEGGIKGMVIRGHHEYRSGDLTLVLQPGWYSATKVPGTTHGSPYSYDTNVPVLFYGKGVPVGSSVKYHAITDIAPTVSLMLNIKFPSGCTGQPIEELFK